MKFFCSLTPSPGMRPRRRWNRSFSWSSDPPVRSSMPIALSMKSGPSGSTPSAAISVAIRMRDSWR